MRSPRNASKFASPLVLREGSADSSFKRTLAAHLADRARGEAPAQPVHRLTLDAGLQTRLEALSAQAVRDFGGKLSIAILVADHQNGEVLASAAADLPPEGRLELVVFRKGKWVSTSIALPSA